MRAPMQGWTKQSGSNPFAISVNQARATPSIGEAVSQRQQMNLLKILRAHLREIQIRGNKVHLDGGVSAAGVSVHL